MNSDIILIRAGDTWRKHTGAMHLSAFVWDYYPKTDEVELRNYESAKVPPYAPKIYKMSVEKFLESWSLYRSNPTGRIFKKITNETTRNTN